MKNYNKLTDADKEQVVQLYYENKTKTIKEIAHILQFSERSVSRVLQEIGINTRLKNRYVIKNENYFNKIDTEFKAYILGFIYADGYVGNHNDFCIALSDKCKDNYKILDIFRNELKTELRVNHTIDKNGYGHYVFKFSNEKIVSQLNKLGVFPCKSLLLEDLPNIPQEMFYHFIRGYFDGDGSIFTYYDSYDKRERYCMEILGTPNFLMKMQRIIEIECQIKMPKLHNVNRVHNLTRISCKGVKKLIVIRDYLYKDAHYYLTYKHDRFYNLQSL